MEIQRLREIIDSPKNIEVTYNNKPVWIKRLDNKNNTANVNYLDTNDAFNVSVTKLKEN
ncbi:H-type small acid-soluble spore protein [Abyssisolibacter fermentans]|uniref:H-type small acid-soluble spore protein n=1 Tax=Abyssisolibacter fermentans TaxID=1766203 RepID=UPI0009E9BE87|nr:H-type small acid-soluble spore protein [Abyssisolibacter fermentans]